DRLFSISYHRVRGERDDRYGSGFRNGFKTARRFPTIQHREAHIPQYQDRCLRSDHRHALFSIQGDGDSITAPFETARQHVTAHIIILYAQDILYATRPVW